MGTLTRAFAISTGLLLACGDIDTNEDAGDAASDAATKSDVATEKKDAEVPLKHRATGDACPAARGPGPPTQPYAQGQSNGCMSDSDCTAGQNGRCFPFEGLVGPGGCSYDQCFADATCGPLAPCICRASATDDTANVCDLGGNCAIDFDCGPGGYCSPTPSCGYASPAPYFCHTTNDECINDADCPFVDAGAACASFASCAYDGEVQHWACKELTCCPP